MILTIIYYLLPAATANIGASVSSKIFPKWNTPIDQHKTYRKHPILGNHKTIRGFVCGSIIGFIVYIIQIYLYNNSSFLNRISYINYNNYPLYFGLLLSSGALLGDLAKSFFKRQMNIPSGKTWLPFDQIDWIIGSLIITSLVTTYNALFILLAISIGFTLHLVVKAIGYLAKIEKTPI